MNPEATELRDEFLKHLGRRPNEFRYSNRDNYRRKYCDWRDKLDDLKISIAEGQSTDDIATDYALMRAFSKTDALVTETYLHNLQDRIKLAIGQEILIKGIGTSVSGCSDFGGSSQIYHYEIYQLAHIQSCSFEKRIDRTMSFIPSMFLYINTNGYARCDTDFGLYHSNEAEFVPKNLRVPSEEDSVAVGTEEIMTWRTKNPYNEARYQKLSQTLEESLAQKISSSSDLQ